VVDLVNRLDIETRNGRQGRLAELLTRMDFIILDDRGYLPFTQSGGQFLFHLVSRLSGQSRAVAGCVQAMSLRAHMFTARHRSKKSFIELNARAAG